MKLPVRLVEYLPEFLRDVREFDEILKSGSEDIGQAELARRSVLENSFLEDITEIGAGRWEAMLGLQPKDTETLDDRKFRIKSYMIGDRPYTFRALLQRLEQLCGGKDNFSAVRYPAQYKIVASVALTAKGQLKEVRDAMERMLPYNMTFECGLKYNQYQTLGNMTYGEMTVYTHNQLREEVLS